MKKLKNVGLLIGLLLGVNLSTFASEADRESLGQLALWLRTSVHPQAVIDVGLQPGLVAGVYLRTANRVFDLSLKGALKQGRGILASDLEALRARS